MKIINTLLGNEKSIQFHFSYELNKHFDSLQILVEFIDHFSTNNFDSYAEVEIL